MVISIRLRALSLKPDVRRYTLAPAETDIVEAFLRKQIGPRLLLCKHSPQPGNYGRVRANQPLAAAVSTPLTMSWAEP